MKPFGPAGWLARICLFLVVASITGLFQLDRQARTQTDLAAIVPVGLGGFADERMIERLAIIAPDQALGRAEQLLHHRPTDAHNLGIFALSAVEAGDSERAGRALTLAAQRGWRDPYTQVSVTGSALAQQQWEVAAQRIDALARTRREQETIFAALRYMLAEPEGRVEIAKRLVVSEPLAAALAEFTRANGDFPNEVAAVLKATHAKSGDAGVSCANYARIVRALLAQSEGVAALQAWPAACASGSREGIAFAFTEGSDDPFAWTFPSVAGVSVNDGNAPGAIDIRNRDLLRRQVAFRYLVLTPGRYSLRIERSAKRGEGFAGGPSAQFSVLLRCDRRGGNASGALINGNYDAPITFSILPDCPIQFVSLTASQGRADDVRVFLD